MYNQGDILLIPFPFSDYATNKQRPVLVLSNDTYNQRTEELIVAAMTTQLRNLQYSILINGDDLSEGILTVTTAVRVNKLYTLSQKLVKKKFGHITRNAQDKIILKMNELCL